MVPRGAGWWHQWNRWRDIDDYRSWYGRGKSRQTPSTIYPLLPDQARTAQFEDTLVASLDAARAFDFLTARQAAMLAMRALGYGSDEIGAAFGCTANTAEVTISDARRRMRALCAMGDGL